MARTLIISSSVIEVSANSRMTEGMIASHRFTGVLPGCKKNVQLTDSVGYMGITVRPLMQGSGSASIHPDEWASLLAESPVVSSKLFPVEITPAIEAWARQSALSITVCPAVRSMRDVHPDYARNQKWDSIKRRAILTKE